MWSMLRTRNVGALDRVARALPAVLAVYLWWTSQLTGIGLVALGVVAVMLLVTSILGSCSIYYMLGWSTCPIKERQ